LNGNGQLGDGTTANSSRPVSVLGLESGVKAISAGYYHTCALMTAGDVRCWGGNEFGQLGNGPRDGSPHPDSATAVDVLAADSLSPVDALRGITAISAGGLHTCALTEAGGVLCWGGNSAGQLGYGKATDFGIPWPIDVEPLQGGVTSVVAGPDHTCASGAEGVRCWGNNGGRQLGDGSTNSATTPVDVAGLGADIIAFGMGYEHTCALSIGGGLKCWGSNGYGQLGDATTNPGRAPVDVAGLRGHVAAIAQGNSWAHTCVLMDVGAVRCWGQNAYGQLGNGSVTDSGTPVDVSDLDSDATAVAVGYYHSCALTSAGSVDCWGNNSAGGLGDGSTIDSNVPVKVRITTPELPQTDSEAPGPSEGLAVPPWLAILVGLSSVMAVLVRRRTRSTQS
jgi:alpha-tubulin suppressor-like RCC1 family protein